MKLVSGIVAGVLTVSSAAYAQTYPAKTPRIIVSFAAGGGTDTATRMVAERLVPVFKQQVVVDNRPGGATNIGAGLAARAAPDGYTLLVATASNAINMSLFAKPPYDFARDFEPIILFAKGANVLAVHPSLPVKTVKDLIVLARTQPGKLNYASAGLGSASHLAGELLNIKSGILLTHVPYKGNTPALADLIGGHVEMIFSGVTAQLPHINAGRIRPIAVAGTKRFVMLPALVTFEEAGIRDFEVSTWAGLLAPARTPQEIVAYWNREVDRIVRSEELRKQFAADGLEPMGGSADEFRKFIQAEIDKYALVVDRAKIMRQ
jgi:tripartite-type tricarboxylate transporter receptor subunit TctC